jgi:hypothetical protein
VKSSARFGGAAFLKTEWKRVKVISYFLKAVLKGREMLIKCKLFLFLQKYQQKSFKTYGQITKSIV